MKFKISKKWLLGGTNEEDTLPISAGALSADMMTRKEDERPRLAREQKQALRDFMRSLEKTDPS